MTHQPSNVLASTILTDETTEIYTGVAYPRGDKVSIETLARWEIKKRSPSAARDYHGARAQQAGKAAKTSISLGRHDSYDGPANAAIWARLAWRHAAIAITIQETGRCRKSEGWEVGR
jgi:hypothetical protein